MCVALLFAAGPLSSVVAPTPAAADRAYRTEARLPQGRNLLTAVSAGPYVYVFGGWIGNWNDDILRFDPSTRTVTKMPSRLPEPLRGAGGVWDGKHVYLFAGRTPSPLNNKILRYDPATDMITQMPSRLPWVDELVHAVWDGTGNAYIVGGWYGTHRNRITRYTPATDTVTVMGATLGAGARTGTGAFWEGRHLYAFSQVGLADGDTSVDRYDPATDRTVRMQARIPHGYAIGTAWDGRSAYVFGGLQYWYEREFYDTIVRYDPESDSTMLMNARLPSPRAYSAAAWTGEGIYVIGGLGYHPILDPPGVTIRSMFFLNGLDEIVRYDPVPYPARDLRAAPGENLGEVKLTWEPPPRSTYGSALTGYRVYRGTGVDNEGILAEIPDQTFYVDASCSIGTVCLYRVAAVNATGEGDRSLPAAFPGSSLPG